jgi:hypothetical protein
MALKTHWMQRFVLACVIFLPVATDSNSTDWYISRPEQCPGKVPSSPTPISTDTANSLLRCAIMCGNNQLCSSFYYKDNVCRMFSNTADKDCTGFVAESGTDDVGYFEIRRVSSQTF